MKSLLVLLTTLPAFAFAQNCTLKKEKDAFTQQPRLSTGFMKLGKGNEMVNLNMVAEAKEIKLLYSLGEGTCVTDDSQVIFTFDSSRTKTNQKNTTAMNCDGVFALVFRNGTTTPFALQKLATLKVATMQIVLDEKQKREIVLTEEQKQLLRKRAACMATEAKTLINPS
jgi:hypothetical protein